MTPLVPGELVLPSEAWAERQAAEAAAHAAAEQAPDADEARIKHALEVGAIRMKAAKTYGPSLRERALQVIATAPTLTAAQQVLFDVAARSAVQPRTIRLLRAAVERRGAELMRDALVSP